MTPSGKVTVTGSTTCVPDQVSLKNTTNADVQLTPSGSVLAPGRKITQCFNLGAEGTYTVVTGISGFKSTLTVTVVS